MSPTSVSSWVFLEPLLLQPALKKLKNVIGNFFHEVLMLYKLGSKSHSYHRESSTVFSRSPFAKFLDSLVRKIQRGTRNYFIRKKNFLHLLDSVIDKYYSKMESTKAKHSPLLKKKIEYDFPLSSFFVPYSPLTLPSSNGSFRGPLIRVPE